jgi:hypothetical protein
MKKRSCPGKSCVTSNILLFALQKTRSADFILPSTLKEIRMKKPLAVLMTAALLAATVGPAFAAGPAEEHATAETCQSLAKEADQAVKEHATGPKIDLARKRLEEAEKLCKEGKYTEGVRHYRMAMEDVGVEPATK